MRRAVIVRSAVAGLMVLANACATPGWDGYAGRPLVVDRGAQQLTLGAELARETLEEFGFPEDEPRWVGVPAATYRVGVRERWDVRFPFALGFDVPTGTDHLALLLSGGIVDFGLSEFDDWYGELGGGTAVRWDPFEVASVFGHTSYRHRTREVELERSIVAGLGIAVSPTEWLSFAFGVSIQEELGGASRKTRFGPASDGHAPLSNVAFHLTESFDIGVAYLDEVQSGIGPFELREARRGLLLQLDLH